MQVNTKQEIIPVKLVSERVNNYFMLKVTMFSSATKVKGQGVGSAYLELMALLEKHFSGEFKVSVNRLKKADISHYHTVDFRFFLSTFLPGRGKKIGYVHFLPETLEGSLKFPWLIKVIFYRYLIAFYKRMDALVVVNPDFISKLVAYGIPANKITYIPNFVSKKEFYPQTLGKESLRLKLHLPQRFTVLGVGQVQERKGVFDFIELAKQNPEFQFVWVGGFSFGRITDGYKELKEVVANPPSNLTFPGIVERADMKDYYNVADMFLLPSFNELFPMSVLEAFSCQTPVLLRDLKLYHAIISGYYEPAKDLEEMNEKIRLFAANPEKLTELKEKSQKAASYYSEERLAQVWKEYYIKQVRGK